MNLICFSHLRWGFVFQRPQHLLSRLAGEFCVFYVEEPVYDSPADRMVLTLSKEKVWVAVPHLKGGAGEDTVQRQTALLNNMFSEFGIKEYIFWYYTPMALPYTRNFRPKTVVYDCMDELSAFKFAPPELVALEDELFKKADIVFTGGVSLYEAKKHRHDNIHAFPSSIDKRHFDRARQLTDDPEDQQQIPHPRLGFFGVLDERFDIGLIDRVSTMRPDWQFVLIGPVVKIDPATLPARKNIHYLGGKSYDELPSYIAGWDIAMIPFALNESTRFISPTKTPEYLAAGKPVISTAIRDVVHPYGTRRLVHIINNAAEFVEAAEKELNSPDKRAWLREADDFLAGNSWDMTCFDMLKYVKQQLKKTNHSIKSREVQHV
ncbi:MAG: glycosyltransferase family 1 protein [Chitinophagaceae bacterium]|nr:glycosyltransferase family 1 protein [Chitinophagaceae bacterium]